MIRQRKTLAKASVFPWTDIWGANFSGSISYQFVWLSFQLPCVLLGVVKVVQAWWTVAGENCFTSPGHRDKWTYLNTQSIKEKKLQRFVKFPTQLGLSVILSQSKTFTKAIMAKCSKLEACGFVNVVTAVWQKNTQTLNQPNCCAVKANYTCSGIIKMH